MNADGRRFQDSTPNRDHGSRRFSLFEQFDLLPLTDTMHTDLDRTLASIGVHRRSSAVPLF
jgi:hypothetical protein